MSVIADEIKHQTQLTPTSCVPACMAMISGVDQQSIIDDLDRHHGSCGSLHDEFCQWVRLGYLPQLVPWNSLRHGIVMLATVPSLNIPGGMHRIVIDLRDVLTVYDPNKGRDGRRFYTEDSLHSWSDLTTVEFCGRSAGAG